MGHVELQDVDYVLPDGRVLLSEVSFRAGEGTKTALIGANGTGKSTLLGLIAGGAEPWAGSVQRSGGLGVMPQFLGGRTVRDLVLELSPERLRAAGRRLDAAEDDLIESDGSSEQLRYAEALTDRLERLEELRRRWDESRARLVRLVHGLKQKASYNDGMAGRYQAARTRLARFDAAGPPEAVPRRPRLRMQLGGGRTGRRVLTCERLVLDGLTEPIDTEVFYGDRVGVLGSNGTGKSHFLRLLATLDPDGADGVEPVAHHRTVRLGARVVPGWFVQTHRHPEFTGRSLVDLLVAGGPRRRGIDPERAMRVLARYDLADAAHRGFETLSGGQQARFQVLLLELRGATLLLLDEPTDNLDPYSADVLQEAIGAFDGTVLAVTHDRWLARSFDRFLVFHSDGQVSESDRPVWSDQ